MRRVRFAGVLRSLICVASLFVMLVAAPAAAQFMSARTMQSPRSQALLGSDIAAPADALAANPAADSAAFVAMMYIPTPMAIEGAWSASVSSLYAFDDANRVGAAVLANSFQQSYSDDIASFQYARAIGLKDSTHGIIAGVRMKYESQHFGPEYLPLNVLSVDVGVRFDLLDKLKVGIAVTDLAPIYRNQDVTTNARTAYAGLSWQALSDVSIHCAIEAPQDQAASVLAGVECMLDSHVAVRAGAETAIGELAFGVGLHYTNLQLGMALLHHPLLGSSLSFGLAYGL